MNLKFYSLFILVLLFFANFCFANCTNLLKFEVDRRLAKDSFLFGQKLTDHMEMKTSSLDRDFSKFPELIIMLENKSFLTSKKLKNILVGDVLAFQIKNSLLHLIQFFHSKPLLKEWIQDLYQDVLVEMYLSGDLLDLSRFQTFGTINQKYIMTVLLDRSKRGGFSGETDSIKALEKEVAEDKFKKYLMRKLYIYDSSFEFSNHGHLIHIFQIDLMIYALKKASIDPEMASYLYSWFGRDKIYTSPLGIRFRPLDAWTSLFDSFENDFTSPEKFSPILKDFFQWTRQEHINL